MKYMSVCSGIEAASVAWMPLGWTAVAFSEIDPFPCAVLQHHFPNIPNLGSITTINKDTFNAEFDLLVGGTPCQGFSQAGTRKGLGDERSKLAFEYCRVLDVYRPQWFVWENVPGAFTTNGGAISNFSSEKLLRSGMAFRGEFWTRDTSEAPNDAEECLLSDILETGDHLRQYSLSARACQGILRRAEKSQIPLPQELKKILIQQASMTGTDKQEKCAHKLKPAVQPQLTGVPEATICL